MTPALRYPIQLVWSDEDQAFLVVVPDWADRYQMPVASGTTAQEAYERGLNAVENFIRFAQEDHQPLPEPRSRALIDA